MKKISVIAFSLLLAACGGSSGGDSAAKQPQPVTTENIADAIQISGAQAADTNALEPDSLSTINTANVEEVVVTANSSYKLELSVPEDQIPNGKKVGGYLIELPGKNQFFVPATTSSSAQGLSTQSTQKSNKKGNSNYQTFAAALPPVQSSGQTSITIKGWNNGDFTLDTSLSGLALRIIPLLVNSEVSQVLAIDDIDLNDESNWLGVQEVALKVEAVATAPIQISLTWDTQVDLDLWVVEPNNTKIYYAETISKSSLGWLDYDNTEQYGPENITFQYQMPEGEYKVLVHYYDGSVDTNYTVVVAVGDDVQSYTGNFASNQSNPSAEDDLNANDDSVNDVTTLQVNSSINNQLAAKIAMSQYAGTWKLPAEASGSGYLVITENSLSRYFTGEVGCEGYRVEVDFLPTGMRINNGEFQVSDAFLHSLDETFTYRYLTPIQAVLPDNCVLSDGSAENEEPFVPVDTLQ